MKIYKVNKDIRDLLMRADATRMIERGACIYLGNEYRFTPVTAEETKSMAKKLLKTLGVTLRYINHEHKK